jgi:hypothetical protein
MFSIPTVVFIPTDEFVFDHAIFLCYVVEIEIRRKCQNETEFFTKSPRQICLSGFEFVFVSYENTRWLD